MAKPDGADAWWDQSWNPVSGCLPISPGCQVCYAPRLISQYSHCAGWSAVGATPVIHTGVVDRVNGRPVFNGQLAYAPPGHHVWGFPLRWAGAEHPKLGPGQPSLIFVVDMGDLFIEGRPTEIINHVCATIALSAHIGLFITKRAKRMADYFAALDPRTRQRWQRRMWCGFSAERQKEFDRRWADMRVLANAGWTVFVSIAPMIGPVILPPDFLTLGDRAWVIVAGEVGPHRLCRDMNPGWARRLRDQCAAAHIPFFCKQMAKGAPIPPDLQIRQFPRRTAEQL